MNDNEFQMSSPMTPLQASNMPGEYSFFSFEEVRREETNQRLNYDPEKQQWTDRNQRAK